MKSSRVFLLEVVAFIFTVVVGGALHFTYELSGNNVIVGLFSAVNESPWEHLKLAFVPIILFGIIEYYYLNQTTNNLFLGKLIAFLTTAFIITGVYFGYYSFVGHPILFVDITTFILSSLLGHYLCYKIISSTKEYKLLNLLSVITFIIIAIIFVNFTFNPGDSALFKAHHH
ncbi:DUF6512 family protein [Alloiococcus sp. CFN-8]|uniref:DUF6512 family protein n=1 Tax=Alloiococcus sp. CFN-8 TaxID=3416081 RepID=UPI003CFAAAB9